jgi:hypothetical protein
MRCRDDAAVSAGASLVSGVPRFAPGPDGPPGVAAIGKPDQIDRLIALCHDLGLVGRQQLLRAVRRGEIGIVEPARGAMVPLKLLERSLLPTIAIIGDDDYASTGPAAWPATRRLFRWAAGAMIHATGADAASYQFAIDITLRCRRFLLIETSTAHMRAWGDALQARHIPFIGLQPPSGSHPIMPPKGAMQ